MVSSPATGTGSVISMPTGPFTDVHTIANTWMHFATCTVLEDAVHVAIYNI